MRAPRFTGLRPASAASSMIKKSIRGKDTRAEIALRKALWSSGLRYRLHVSSLPGCPDIIFPRVRVAVFCDGDFWHGRDWDRRRARLMRGANAVYWIAKIETNMARDKRNTAELVAGGWVVIRLWEKDILRNAAAAAGRVRSAILAAGGQVA